MAFTPASDFSDHAAKILEAVAKLIDRASQTELSLSAFLVAVVAAIAGIFFAKEKLWARILAFICVVACVIFLTLVVMAPRMRRSSPSPPVPEVRAVDQPDVSAEPIFIDFPMKNSSQSSGVECNTSREITFPNGPYDVEVNKEFIFQYDGSQICHGQGFDNFQGLILWEGRYITMANNKNNHQYPGIAGSLKVKSTHPGNHRIGALFFLDCLDTGGRRNTCAASGNTEVSVHGN